MPGFPCCCTGCDIASDEFDRASVGAGWTQVSGSWSISSNRLETSDSDALAIFATDHPEGSSSHHISVLGKVSDTGSKIRGIVAYDSADDYIFAELMINSSDCSEIKFFERVGGSTSQVGDTRNVGILATGTDYRLEVCFQDDTYPNDDGELCVKLSLSDGSHSWTFCESSITATGDQVGLGTGTLTSSGSASFESFDWNISKKDQGSCPDCKGSTCLLLSDGFTRADSTDLGCNWTETSGAWSISSNELVTSSASAQATTTMTNFRPGFDIIGGTFRFGTGISDTDAIGDIARMMVDVDGSNSHALQVTCGNGAIPGSATVELLKGTTVLATVAWSLWPGVDWNFSVCLQDGYIEADIHYISGGSPAGQLHLDASTTPYGGNKAALGTGSENDSVIQFDTFTWQRARNPADLNCPDCVDSVSGCANCIDSLGPEKIKLVVSGFSSGSEDCDINGTWILSRISSCRYSIGADIGDSSSNHCLERSFDVEFGHDGTNYFISVHHGRSESLDPDMICPCGSDFTHWQRDFHTPIDCLNLVGLSIPYYSNNVTAPGYCSNGDYSECGFDYSAVEVSAL